MPLPRHRIRGKIRDRNPQAAALTDGFQRIRAGWQGCHQRQGSQARKITPAINFHGRFPAGCGSPTSPPGSAYLRTGGINTAIADRTLADALQEDFIALVAQRQITQIRGDTAGNGAQTVAACAILVVGGISDADRGLILAVRIGFQKVGAEIL